MSGLRLIEGPIIGTSELGKGTFGNVCEVTFERTKYAMKSSTLDDRSFDNEGDLNITDGCILMCKNDPRNMKSNWSCRSSDENKCCLRTCTDCCKKETESIWPTKDIFFCRKIRDNGLWKEVFILKFLSERSDHFPKVFALVDDGKQISYLFELCECDLKKYLKDKNGTPLSQIDKMALTHQLLQGVEFMHRCGIVHNDMKPQNILMKGGKLLITDFGISKESSVKHRSTVVTMDYRSPEGFLTNCLTQKNELNVYSPDLWASGLILFYIWSGEQLFIYRETESEQIFMLLQIFSFWKMTSRKYQKYQKYIKYSDIPDNNLKLLDQYRHVILIPDGHCYYIFGEKLEELVPRDYFDNIVSSTKPFLIEFIKPRLIEGEATYKDLQNLVTSTLKSSDRTSSVHILGPYEIQSRLLDDIFAYTTRGKIRNRKTNFKDSDIVQKIGSRMEESYKHIETAFGKFVGSTIGHPKILESVLRLLSFDRFTSFQALDVLDLLEASKLSPEFSPNHSEFTMDYQICLLQLHYKVFYLELYEKVIIINVLTNLLYTQLLAKSEQRSLLYLDTCMKNLSDKNDMRNHLFKMVNQVDTRPIVSRKRPLTEKENIDPSGLLKDCCQEYLSKAKNRRITSEDIDLICLDKMDKSDIFKEYIACRNGS